MLVVGTLILLAGPPLQVPWTCGVAKPCTQGHNGFSHDGTSEFAWDFDVNEGEEVWASSAGVVSYIRMDSSTGGCDASYASDANYVVVDHDDGTAILYLHLQANSSPLVVGDAVTPGSLIGRVGLTGWVCGDHLHLQVMEQCGSSYCQSLPATFVDYGDPAQGDQIDSTNCPSCPLVLAGGESVLISELEPGCFVRETTAWDSAMSGDDDHHFYTLATDAAEAESTGTWRFGVEVPGDYRVEVFVPDADADATGAVYQVHHEGGVAMIAIDQATAKGWQELGVFGFSGTEGERVQLDDNTGEAIAMGRRLGYDAVRFGFVPSAGTGESGGPSDTSDGDPSDPSGASDPSDPSAGSGSASGTVGDDASATSADDGSTGTGGGGALPDGWGDSGDDSGCGCATRPTRSEAAWWWLLLAGLPRRRRRRES